MQKIQKILLMITLGLNNRCYKKELTLKKLVITLGYTLYFH